MIIGHGASSDLRALRLIHKVVVDSMLIEYLPVKNKEMEAAKKRREAKEVEEKRAADQAKKQGENNGTYN